ncbi:serine/threonine-protein kinase/endoribonuclease IRE1-like [Xenia sp. Carnegie-2017]|uniref:serine/threonine-protein kinase/endoribonuclease IRE1-like n=1 Tax=Xenia sp. Carnegie-2017 TaxID=2897299 RepID=UPI001F03E940|nr:serine/threonine-protein kinase/endoribonuclease IRE1-like [Xenia sp. Carnegie-2017]
MAESEITSGDDAKDVGSSSGVENTKQEKQFPKWKCTEKSTKHRKLLLKLIEYDRDPNVKVENVGDVRVIFSDEFCIGKGNNETRVYLGLRKDGFGKAVKRIRRDNCFKDALQEKEILNDFNAKKSRYVVNYSNIEDEIGSEYVYLILDLCEESLENFPSNVLRDSQSKFLIADFGISRILNNGYKTYKSKGNMGTEDWIAPESYCEDNDSVDKGRYKKDRVFIIVECRDGGLLCCNKRKHPLEISRETDNMLNGKPVGLDKIKDETLNDLLLWMLNLKPEDRPSAIQALKHPFLMSDDDKFDFLCKVGNQQPIKTSDNESSVVKQLNSKYSNWESFIDIDVYDYLRTDEEKGKMKTYGPSLTKCLRLIRNVGQHWYDRPQPRPQPFYKIGDHKAFFLKTFPNLPAWVHAAVRSNEEFRNYEELENFFNESKPHQ